MSVCTHDLDAALGRFNASIDALAESNRQRIEVQEASRLARTVPSATPHEEPPPSKRSHLRGRVNEALADLAGVPRSLTLVEVVKARCELTGESPERAEMALRARGMVGE